ncbi:MAG TPA: type II secretion system protein GspK [Myxococcota bacterium]|nr:type II secretion system protein GspK [Myxococcota bacterium]HOH75810.1 type II secretion system protein GspK [Myxococcota bacterium]
MGRRSNNRGVALIVVLTGITILAAFSSEFTYRSRVDIRTAMNQQRRVQAYFHARSGMEIGRLVITSQKMVDQALSSFGLSGRAAGLELWRFAPKFVDVFTSSSLEFLGFKLMDLSGVRGIGVGAGGFELEIVPEDSRINVNSGSSDKDKREIFSKLYPILAGQIDEEPMTGMDRKAAEVILNIIDWADPDDSRSDIDSNGNLLSTVGGSENMNYSKWGYTSRNARMDSLDELLMIEGVTDSIFCRFSRMLTVYNTSKINVNDADPWLIKAVVCDNLVTDKLAVCGYNYMSPGSVMDQAMYLFETCRQIKQQLNMPPFMSASQFVNFWTRLPEPLNQLVVVNPETLRASAGTKSTVLRVVSRGWVDESGHEMSAVIDTGSTRWLSWKERGFDASGKRDMGQVDGVDSAGEAGTEGR